MQLNQLSTIFISILLSSTFSLHINRRATTRTTNSDGSVTTLTSDGNGTESWVTESKPQLGSVSRSGPIVFPGVRQLANLFGVSNSRFDQLIQQAAKPILEQSDRDLQNRINAALNS